VSELVERHFDYVLGPNQDNRLASVAPGVTMTSVLHLRSDAPFVRRSHALRQQYVVATSDQAGLQFIRAKHYGPDRNQLSQNLVRQSLLSPYFGQVGNPIPQYPELYYPPGGEIRVDINNDSSSTTLTNLTFVFRGVQLFQPGAVKAYTYPDRFGLFDFTYPVTASALPVTSPGQLVTFLCKTDADFCLQGLQAGFINNLDANGFPVLEVGIQLQDEDQKPYSNDFVHMDILCGQSGMGSVFPTFNASNVPPVAGGPNSKGLVFPEIYVPANHVLYVKVNRADSPFAGAEAVDFPIMFIGQKVFEK